jgi:tetratricopeptide (TPR) repeat protein
VVDFLREAKEHARADALVRSLLADKKYAAWPWLWRLAAETAEGRGMTAQAIADRARAVEIEFEKLPDTINVEWVRREYGGLLDQCRKLTPAAKALDDGPSPKLVAQVIRAADRWRQLDTDPTAACQAAAGILGDLGAADLAWEYLTTPLSARPNEAAPWTDLAKKLREQGHIELADRAYASAFDAEPTNAQILWDRAQALQDAGRAADAQRVFRQIAEGQWQARFNGLRDQAVQQVLSY